MKILPSLFNDIIGPVMRGPSSSHTAASWRIARIALELLNHPLEKALIEFDRDGAWAPNYREQGTTMGMDGGLLGLEITDERMKDTERYARKQGITIEYQISSFPTNQANTARLTLWSKSKKRVQIIAVSLGGGSFEITSVNGFTVRWHGDLYGMLLFAQNKPDVRDKLKTIIPSGIEFSVEQKENRIKYEIKSSNPFSSELITRLKNDPAIDEISVIKPIMPITVGKQTKM